MADNVNTNAVDTETKVDTKVETKTEKADPKFNSGSVAKTGTATKTGTVILAERFHYVVKMVDGTAYCMFDRHTYKVGDKATITIGA